MQQSKTRPFFVGWGNAMPPGLRRFYLVLIPILFLALGVIAGLLASSRPAPQPGTWAITPTTLTGLVTLAPYPLLRVSAPDGGVETILLMATGKHGADARVAAFNNRILTVSGLMIDGGDRRALELLDETSAVAAQADSRLRASQLVLPPPRRLGTQTLRGEILDSKCYLGVMQPGFGKTHKSCAALCLLGGLPPLFVHRQEDGTRQLLLITDRQGQAIGTALTATVGLPVQVTGDVERRGDLLYLRLDPADIERI